MTLFLRELNRNSRSFIIWTTSLVTSSVLMMLLFPYMQTNIAEMMKDMTGSMPEGMVSALNLGLDFSKVLPFFAYLFQYIILFSAIYAMLLGAGILSREEGEKTVEFLLAKPVTRNGIITSKLSCLLVYLVVFNLIFAAADYAAIRIVSEQDFSIKLFILLHFGQLLIQFVFALTGLLISVFVTRTATIYPLSVGVVLLMYFISIISGISGKLGDLKYLTPFEYAMPADIVRTGGIEPVCYVIIGALIVACTAGTYVFYNRKDIRA
ncbi:MAG TPA: ABC transporter permease subunit [Clostridia bacterium]|nr:ABC transporter permease subunit [Clostridia bacterium]